MPCRLHAPNRAYEACKPDSCLYGANVGSYVGNEIVKKNTRTFPLCPRRPLPLLSPLPLLAATAVANATSHCICCRHRHHYTTPCRCHCWPPPPLQPSSQSLPPPPLPLQSLSPLSPLSPLLEREYLSITCHFFSSNLT